MKSPWDVIGIMQRLWDGGNGFSKGERRPLSILFIGHLHYELSRLFAYCSEKAMRIPGVKETDEQRTYYQAAIGILGCKRKVDRVVERVFRDHFREFELPYDCVSCDVSLNIEEMLTDLVESLVGSVMFHHTSESTQEERNARLDVLTAIIQMVYKTCKIFQIDTKIYIKCRLFIVSWKNIKQEEGGFDLLMEHIKQRVLKSKEW